MNFFSAFNFGSLIKSLIPGAVVFVALLLLTQGFFKDGYAFLLQDSTRFTFIAIGSSTLLGLTLNTIVFLFFLDVVIRNPLENDVSIKFDSEFSNHINLYYIEKFKNLTGFQISSETTKNFDSEYILLTRAGFSNFAFFREGYWFWLEFQTNMILASVILAISILITNFFDSLGYIEQDHSSGFLFVAILVGLAFVFWIAAKKNYLRHRNKMIAVKLGAFIDSEASSGCRDIVTPSSSPVQNGQSRTAVAAPEGAPKKPEEKPAESTE